MRAPARHRPRFALRCAATGLAAALGSLAAALAAETAPTAFVDVTVLPMDRDRAIEHATVVVDGGRIIAVGSAAEVAVPAAATRIDGRGRFLLPGFVDAHVHLYSPIELPLYLANGVTTVFNLNGRPAHLEWRDRVAKGELEGPRIVTVGPTFMTAHSADEAVRLVDEIAAAGYDGVKVYNQVSAAEYPALAAATRRHRLLFTGHVAREPGFEATLAAGQSIAHVEEFMYTFFNPRGDDDSSHIVYDAARIPEAVRKTKAAGVAVTPTLSMYRDILRQATDLPGYLRNPELASLPPALRAEMEPAMNRYHDRYPADELERMQLSLALQRKLVRALREAGVPILTGTDASGGGPVAGYAIHEEIAELGVAGLSPFAALEAATAAPARWFGRGESGTIAAGERADLVLLGADPRVDLHATRRIEGVMAAGRWRDRAALDALVAALPASYATELDRLVETADRDAREADAYLASNDPFGILSGSVLERIVVRDGAAAARASLRRLREKNPDSLLAGEEAVNGLGYRMLGLGRNADAVALFEANAEEHPGSANAVDSLADGWAHAGDDAKAVAYYRKALEIDPSYANSPYAREFLAKQGAVAK